MYDVMMSGGLLHLVNKCEVFISLTKSDCLNYGKRRWPKIYMHTWVF